MPSSCFGNSVFPLFLFLFLFLLHQKPATCSNEKGEFTFNGFREGNLTLNGSATITSGGLLMITNSTAQMKGLASNPTPFRFRKLPHDNGSVFSFSTTFVFAIIPRDGNNVDEHTGMTFFISPAKNFSALGSQFSGPSNSRSYAFAVDLGSLLSIYLGEILYDHVRIYNGSVALYQFDLPAGYFDDDTRELTNLSLSSGEAMQVWVDYASERTQLNVTLAPIPMAKPHRPLLSVNIDLSSVFSDSAYVVGISAPLGPFRASSQLHFVLGWSFKMNGTAQPLDYNLLPTPPRTESKRGSKNSVETGLPIASAGFVLVIAIIIIIALVVMRRRKYAEVLEDWEKEFGPQRFSYRDLFEATKGFAEKELLGRGGFGEVYKGVLLSLKVEVAVKRVSHESRQGMREFIAEIVSLGRLRHRNLVKLFGYCRRKGELLLVYEHMPSGSLDKFLFDHSRPALDWAARLRIIRGVAAGLLYLHEDWDQVVLHRDIKASNVLLDEEFNGRLGDFGLARLYDHGSDPLTTHVVGTMGYLAPELSRTGRATTATDVFAFGTFVLEVACGRRPVSLSADGEPLVLADWVAENWRKGSMLATRDPRLGEEYAAEEVELVLKLGLLCSHPLPASRPGMRRVVQWLEGDAALPELSATYFYFRGGGALVHGEDFNDSVISYPSSPSLATASDISRGR